MLIVTDGKKNLFLPTVEQRDKLYLAFTKPREEITMEEFIALLNELRIPYQVVDTLEEKRPVKLYSSATRKIEF
jgi:hypothetical protein